MPLTMTERKTIMRLNEQKKTAERKRVEAGNKLDETLNYYKRMIRESEEKFQSIEKAQNSKIASWNLSIGQILTDRCSADFEGKPYDEFKAAMDAYYAEFLPEFHFVENGGTLPDSVAEEGNSAAGQV